MRLLLIEDELKFGESLKKALQSESYAVDWATSGEKGLSQARVENYDLAIIDIGLPDVSGLEVVQQLRHQRNTLPVLFLTALGQTKDKIRGLDAGGDDYMVKPIVFEELLARLRSLMRRPAQSETPDYTYDTLHLDPASHRVTRVGQEVNLSLKEFALLDYLMRNQEKVVSRQDILDHVWDEDVDPFSNIVDVYIGYLRTKIDKAFPAERALIKTVKGIGYKLTA